MAKKNFRLHLHYTKRLNVKITNELCFIQAKRYERMLKTYEENRHVLNIRKNRYVTENCCISP